MRGTEKYPTTKYKYVGGTDLYPHMPILRPHAAHNAHNDRPLAGEHARWPIRQILGFRGSQVLRKWEITFLGRRKTSYALTVS